MEVPEKWLSYPCEDYFAGALAERGHWDGPSQLWLVEPAARVEEDAGAEFLQVGRPGVDSIGFLYRKGQRGFWAYHRIEQRFQYLAPDVNVFLEGWLSGRITV